MGTTVGVVRTTGEMVGTTVGVVRTTGEMVRTMGKMVEMAPGPAPTPTSPRAPPQ